MVHVQNAGNVGTSRSKRGVKNSMEPSTAGLREKPGAVAARTSSTEGPTAAVEAAGK